MRCRQRIWMIVTLAVTLVSIPGPVFGIVAGISSVRNISYSSCGPRERDFVFIRALETEGCRFLGGIWVNGRSTLGFSGDTKALNLMIHHLSECPATRVTIDFQEFKTTSDWKIVHKSGIQKFSVTVNLCSPLVEPNQVKIAEADRPELEQ